LKADEKSRHLWLSQCLDHAYNKTQDPCLWVIAAKWKEARLLGYLFIASLIMAVTLCVVLGISSLCWGLAESNRLERTYTEERYLAEVPTHTEERCGFLWLQTRMVPIDESVRRVSARLIVKDRREQDPGFISSQLAMFLWPAVFSIVAILLAAWVAHVLHVVRLPVTGRRAYRMVADTCSVEMLKYGLNCSLNPVRLSRIAQHLRECEKPLRSDADVYVTQDGRAVLRGCCTTGRDRLIVRSINKLSAILEGAIKWADGLDRGFTERRR
jgi:hypothetical protein